MATLTQVPQYQQLYEALRQDIIRNVFKAGELLPSEKVLQNQYRLTQPTVRQALSLLVQDGYIRKHQGKGSIVQPIPLGLGVTTLRSPTSPADPDRPAEHITTTILTKPYLCPFPDDFSLRPTSGIDEFYCFERLRLANNVPVFLETLFLPNRYLPNFLRQRLADRSFFDLLRTKYGLIVTGGEQQIQALMADERVAAQLNIAVGHPVLRLTKRIDTNKADFSFFSLLFARTDQFLLQGRF